MEKVFRDPVHDLIGFDRDRDRLVLDLVETRELQRLRHIKLMGTSYVVYPSADHNRFAHSLGATFLMKRIINGMAALGSEPGYRRLAEHLEAHRELMLAAAMVHDIGHFPFSHVLERFVGESHETWTVRLVRDPDSEVHHVLRRADPSYPDAIARVINRTFQPSFVVKLIASQLDVDRMDYLLRDSVHTGVGYGRYDLAWLLHSLRIVQRADGDWEIAVDAEKGRRAVESYVLARYYMYQQVYHHKTSRAASALLVRILKRASALTWDGARLPAPEPVAGLLADPTGLTARQFTALDDVTLGYAVREWARSDDAILSDLAQRFLQRQPFKTIPIESGRFELMRDELRKIVSDAGFDPDYYLVFDRAIADPYSDGLFAPPQEAEVGERIHLLDRRHRLQELSEESELIRAVTNRRVVRDRLCVPAELKSRVETLLG